ncbi:hypothetical protein M3Y98_01030800 [Aphelenchoides besseyi]|nr:hypothetical protein M3Y98_01030800 [Aphelenchoides besseyi]KAI6209974.1 hypothetical protein M3Y96_00277800 [Aphelenchoides besseyi]
MSLDTTGGLISAPYPPTIHEVLESDTGVDPRLLSPSNQVYDYNPEVVQNYRDYPEGFNLNGTVFGIDQPATNWPVGPKDHPWWVPLLIIVGLLVIILIVVAVAIYCGLRGTFSEPMVATPRRRFDIDDPEPSDQTSGRLVMRSESRQTCGSSRGLSLAHEAQEITEMQTLLAVPLHAPAPTPARSSSNFDIQSPATPTSPLSPTSPRLLEVGQFANVSVGVNDKNRDSITTTSTTATKSTQLVPDDPGHSSTISSTSRSSSLKPQYRSTDTQTEEDVIDEITACKF